MNAAEKTCGNNTALENIPAELKQLNQWVIWGVDKTKPKMPFNPKDMRVAKAGNPQTWGTYEQAVTRIHTGQAGGVGFEFHEGGYCGIDLDTVRNPKTGEISKQALEIIEMLNSYTEISPSGYGFHIIVKCDIILKCNKKKLPEETIIECLDAKGKAKASEIEIYNKDRYFTVTGNIYDEIKPIAERTEQLQAVYDKYLKPKPIKPAKQIQPIKTHDDYKTDNDYLNIGLEKDSAFKNLWNGNRPNGNESSDDLALINKLAYWCNGNESLIQSAFLSSPHYTSKDSEHKGKCSRQDYIPRTVARAIKGLESTAQKKHSEYIEKRDTLSTGRIHLIEKKDEKSKKAFEFINPLKNPMRYSLDHIGMGYIFADTFKNISRYVPESKSWYVYNGKVWRQDLEGLKAAQMGKDLADFLLKCAFEIQDIAKQKEYINFVVKVMSNRGRKIMLEEARSVYPVSIKEFDTDKYLFNCQNCTLDLRGFKIRPHRPEDLLSKISNVIFDKTARCERWESFISEIMQGDGETAKFLQKALGYSLTGDTSIECLFILYGSTARNGKGTCMETTLNIMGDYGKTAQPETIGQKNNPNSSNASEDLARLKGARFVNMPEPDKGLRLNAALIKQMTGRDTINARYLHQNSFDYIPEFKLFINTNHLPKITDDTVFKGERIKLIPFERRFEEHERDAGLKDLFKQQNNVSGIFNWFIEGLKLFTKEGLEQPGPVASAIKEYRESCDTIGLFIKECLTPSVNSYTKIQTVYSTYDRWCDECGYFAMNKSNLIDELKKKGMYKRHRNLGYVLHDYIVKNI